MLRRAGRYLADGFLEAAWPTRCAGCETPGSLLCPSCAAALPAVEQARACPHCGAPFGSLVCTECTRCRERDESDGPHLAPRPPCSDAFADLDGVRCYGVLAWPLDRLVRAYKDGGERRVAPLLAQMAVQAYRASRGVDEGASGEAASADLPDALVFVPCTPEAFARRGFDHMEDVARAASSLLGVPLADVLARRAPRDQRGLGRAGRAENAGASFVALRRLDGMRLLLMDDVVTTGATLSAAARTLRAAGAARVEGLAVARAYAAA